jgi:peroxiredoxin
VAFVAVQTVFEGFSSNTVKQAKETAERYDLDIPIGHSGAKGEFSALMRSYRTGGTPWTIIIDKQGVVRFNGFQIEAEGAIHVLAALKEFEG